MWNVVECDPIVVRELLLGLQPWQSNPDSKCELYTSFVIMLVGVVAAVQGGEDTYAVVRSCQSIEVSPVERFLKKPTTRHSRSSNRGSRTRISPTCYDPIIKNALIVKGLTHGFRVDLKPD
ncbi:hypothetical protein Tco_1018506 [Tanacetum coccineum]|uniref:Uncharacterized protein n=1 Tax=Tanacetum coccineum TaxID=301880 RepID=A0ABQ5FUH1_9ASTR